MTYGIRCVLSCRDRGSLLFFLPRPLRRLLGCYSAVPAPTFWLEGQLGVAWNIWAMNTALWVLILAAKWAFEYYVVAKPLVAPVGVGEGENH